MFKIIRIQNGWFEFSLGKDENLCIFSCTNIGGYDIAQDILKTSNRMIQANLEKRDFYLNCETNIYLMTFTNENMNIHIEIREILDCPFLFLGARRPTSSNIKCGDKIFDTNVRLVDFVHDVWSEFNKIDISDYSSNWFDYPSNEIKKLNDYIKYRE